MTTQSKTFACSNCKKSITDSRGYMRIRFPNNTTRWLTICIDCYLEFFRQSGVPAHPYKFAAWYIEHRLGHALTKDELIARNRALEDALKKHGIGVAP